MPRTLLYYPTFRLPSDEWLRNALLYWDGVGTIVPEEFFPEVAENETIKFLRDEGIYERFEPRKVTRDNSRITDLRDELERRLDSKEFQLIKRRSSPDELFAIEADKMFYEAWDVLIRRKLTENDYNGSKIFVQKPAAILYMGLLAKYLAANNENDLVYPSTNSQVFEDLIFRDNKKNNNEINGMSLTFRRALPRVHSNTSLKDIIKFKQLRREELLAFRVVLDEIQKGLAECTSQNEIAEIITKTSEKIELGIRTLSRQMKESKLRVCVGTLRTIFSSKSPAWLGMLAGAGLGSPTALSGNPTGLIASTSLGFIAGAALEVASYRVEAEEKRTTAIKSSPYSYLYLAQMGGFLHK